MGDYLPILLNQFDAEQSRTVPFEQLPQTIADEGILQPFQSPQAMAFSPDAIERGRHWVVVRESYTGIGFNTKLIAAEKAPKAYQDLLDPQWKGRMSLSGISATASRARPRKALRQGGNVS